METAVKTHNIWNGIMHLRCQLLVLCCICCNPIALSAQERLHELFDCRTPSLTITEFGAVTLRLYPLPSERKSLSSAEASLRSVISERDLLSIGMAHLLAKNRVKSNSQSSTGSSNSQIGGEDNRPLIARKATPDTMVFARGFEIVVFPRVFVALPQVANFAVKNGDFIGTLNRNTGNQEAGREVSDPEEKPDPLRKVLSAGENGKLSANRKLRRNSFTSDEGRLAKVHWN